MRKFAVLLTVAIVLLISASTLQAATSIYGISGLIETPDDTIVSSQSIMPTANRIFGLNVHGVASDYDITTFGGAVGIIPNLEVSAVGIDSDKSGVSTEALINAKYRVLPETVSSPSVTVGVVDMAQRIERFTPDVDGMSSFIVVGKNISNMAEGVSGAVSKPIRGTVGIGTGIYKGAFAGLDMSLAPQVSVAVEYLNKGIRDETTFNGMVRFRPIEALSVDAGMIGFKDFYAGASFNLSTF